MEAAHSSTPESSRPTRSPKDEAVNKIGLGLLLKIGPLILLGLIPETHHDSGFFLVASFLWLGLFIQGYILFVRGTLEYADSQNRRAVWGWLGLLSIWSLPVIICLPERRNLSKPKPQSDNSNPFTQINLVELALLPLIAEVALYILVVCMVAGFSSLTIDQVFEMSDESSLPIAAMGLSCEIALCTYFVFKIRQSRVAFKTMLGRFQAVRFRQVLGITVVDLLFAFTAAWLTLYGISFLAPGYVAETLNRQSYTDVPTFLLWSFSVVVIAPLLEEFIFRGLILHKLALKWGLVPGVLVSSLLFSLIHFRFDLGPLFLAGLLFAFLYLRSGSLWSSICCHALYNFCVVSFSALNRLFSAQTTYESDEALILAYQQWVQSGLWILVPLFCASSAGLAYFIWKIRPKANPTLPYFVNWSQP